MFANKKRTKEGKFEILFFPSLSIYIIAVCEAANARPTPLPHPTHPLHLHLTPAYAVFDFQSKQNGLNDPKGNKNIICWRYIGHQ